MPPDPSPPSARSEPPDLPVIGRSLVELFALAGLAVAQPLLDVFGRAPEHLIFRGADRSTILAFALLVVLAVPAVLWVVETVLRLLRPRLADLFHRTALVVLAAVGLALLVDAFLPRILALPIAIALAALFLLAYLRTAGPRIWLAFLSPAPIVFLALFLLASPVAPLLRSPAGALGVPVGRPTRTVVVILDELPTALLLDEDGAIDADLFPNLAHLAGTSHWFRQTTTTANTTILAVPSMLTGDLPVDGSTPSSSFFPHNLFTLVGGAMPIHSSEAITQLCPSAFCERMDTDTGGLGALVDDAGEVLRQRLDPRDPDIDVMRGVADDELTAPAEAEGADEVGESTTDGGAGRFDRFIDSIGPEPGLHLAHLLLPHNPYRLLPDGFTYPREGVQRGRLFDGWVDDPVPVDLGVKRFLLQLQWTDALVGRLVDHLQDEGLWDDTNLIVTADHGFGYEPGGGFRAMFEDTAGNDTAIAEILWVPFLVKTAGQTEGVVSDDPVRNLDLTPTIADLLDVDIPWEHAGRSAFDGGSGDPDEVGMYLGTASEEQMNTGPYRPLDRSLGWSLLLDRTAARFAPAEDGATGSDRIYRTGPRPDLFGRPLPDGLDPIDVDITEAPLHEDVDLDSRRVPALLSSTTTAVPAGTAVAVSVNGTVWSTTTAYELDGDVRIDTILAPAAFRPGSNDVRVHRLDSPNP